MKAIVCEMCASRDVVKQDGVYVCQSCGTKYTTEDAKKLMVEIEGTVDVSGSTVIVDNSSQLEKSLENARRAKKKEDWEETEKYYNIVEQFDPSSIEANFYSAYAKARASLTNEDIFHRQSVFNSLTKSCSIVNEKFDVSKADELCPIIITMSDDVNSLLCSSYVFQTTTKIVNGIKTTNDNKSETINLFRSFNKEFAKTLCNIANKLAASRKDYALKIYDRAIRHLRLYADKTTELYGDRIAAYQEIAKICREVKQIDPTHSLPNAEAEIRKLEESQKKQHRGCLFGVIILVIVIIVCIIIISTAAK